MVPPLEKELWGTIAKDETEGNGESKGCCNKDKGCVSSKGADEGKLNNTMVNTSASMGNTYKTTKHAQQEGENN